MSGGINFVAISDDLWDTYRSKHISLIQERDSRNKPSLLIDEVIKWLHTSIGFNPGSGDITGRSMSGEGTIESYYATIFELASIPRILRRKIGEKFLEKLVKADKVGDGYAVVQISNELVFWFWQPLGHGRCEQRNVQFCSCRILRTWS